MNARLPPPPAPSQASDRALPAKTAIDEFEIERVLSSSSFSIVYRAYDHVLKLHVAIKEYLPDALALRGGETQVVLRNRDAAERFQLGAQSFVGESQTLARCDHPALVRVQRILQRHGTFYRVMRYTPGPTLLQLRRETGAPPDPAAMRGWLAGLLGALEALHDEGCVHGGVTPGNVLLLPGDRPILLDFDAVRGVLISDHTQSMMAALEPSFAPPEQHSPSATSVEGPWTDLYSLAASLRFCIGGELPPAPSSLVAAQPPEPFAALWQRMAQTQPALADAPAWFTVLDACQQDDPARRPQNVAQVRALLAEAATAAPVRRARAPRAAPRYLSDLHLGPLSAQSDVTVSAAAGVPQAPVTAADVPREPVTTANAAAAVSAPGPAAAGSASESAPESAPPGPETPPEAVPPVKAVDEAAPRPKPLSTPNSRVIADLDETFAFIARQASADAATPRRPSPPAPPPPAPAAAKPAPPDNLLLALLATQRGRWVLGGLGLMLLAGMLVLLFWLYKQAQPGVIGGGAVGSAGQGLAAAAVAAPTPPALAPLPDAPTAAGPAAGPAPAEARLPPPSSVAAPKPAPLPPSKSPKPSPKAPPTTSTAPKHAAAPSGSAAQAARPADPATKVASGPARHCAPKTGSAFEACMKKQCAKTMYAGHLQCAAPALTGA